MNINHGETSLVIAGAWNPAILSPQWVLQHGLGKALDGTNRIQAYLPAGQGVIFEFPRYVLEDFTFTARADALVIVPIATEQERMAVAEDAAAKMLQELRHTPLGGIGHNFEFHEPNPQPDQLQVFTDSRQDIADEMPEGWNPTSAVVVSSFASGTNAVVLNISRHFEAGTLLVKMNFHHSVADVDQALQILRGENGYFRMAQNFETARSIVTKLYGDINNG